MSSLVPRPAHCIVVALAASATLVPSFAFATDYMSAAEAARELFPQASAFAPRAVVLSAEQSRALMPAGGGSGGTAFWKVQTALAGEQVLGWVVTDRVVGKFELIDYAVGLAPDGTIKGIEILSYREAHGGEVRTSAWRNQFVGKSANAPLAINDDIANISGATLSCTHLTDGIRRIASFAQRVLAKG